MSDHIVKSFDGALESLRNLVDQMGKSVMNHLQRSIEAVTEQKVAQAADIPKLDLVIDNMEHEISESVVKVLALRHPVAQDLRIVIGALKISSDLERIGDHAVNIFRRAVDLKEAHVLNSTQTLVQMYRQVHDMLNKVLLAYKNFSSIQAMDVWHMDKNVDAMYTSYLRELLTYMMEDPRHIGTATHLLFVAKNIERTGDHITNIAEVVYYIVTGNMMQSP